MTVTEEAVREARARAAIAHGEVLGNTSACAIAKSGQSFPAGKFFEGQTSALSELLRTKSAQLSAEVVALHQIWSTRHIAGSPRDVEAYRSGGLEALAAFLPEGH